MGTGRSALRCPVTPEEHHSALQIQRSSRAFATGFSLRTETLAAVLGVDVFGIFVALDLSGLCCGYRQAYVTLSAPRDTFLLYTFSGVDESWLQVKGCTSQTGEGTWRVCRRGKMSGITWEEVCEKALAAEGVEVNTEVIARVEARARSSATPLAGT